MPVTALVLVDLQPTFCEDGDLPVAGGNAVVKACTDYVREHYNDFSFIVTTQDWHIDPGDHFSDTPDFETSFPPHGVVGTDEALLHPEVQALIEDGFVVDGRFLKGQREAAFSGFQGFLDEPGVFSSVTLDSFLRSRKVTHLKVVGLAFGHCVKATAIDGAERGYVVDVIKSLTASVDPGNDAADTTEMELAGVMVKA